MSQLQVTHLAHILDTTPLPVLHSLGGVLPTGVDPRFFQHQKLASFNIFNTAATRPMSFLKRCGIGSMGESQPKEESSEAPSGASAPIRSDPNSTTNHDTSASQANITCLMPKKNMESKMADQTAAEAGDQNSAQDKQENLNAEPIATPSHQTEPMSILESNASHTPAFTLSDDDGAPSTPAKTQLSPIALRPTRMANLPPTKTAGSRFEFDFSSMFNPEASERESGGYLSREPSPPAPRPNGKEAAGPKGYLWAKEGSHPKHQKKAKTVKKGRPKVIGITSDESSGLSSNEVDDPWDNTDSQEVEGQMTDDEMHLTKAQGKKSDKEVNVTGLKKVLVKANEPEKGLGEDEGGVLKVGGGARPYQRRGDLRNCQQRSKAGPQHVDKGADEDEGRAGERQTKEGSANKDLRVEDRIRHAHRGFFQHFDSRSGVSLLFHGAGFDSGKYPIIFNMVVKYISSTNFFQAKVFSGWRAQKRINTEADLLRAASARYPHYVLTMAPDLILCLIAAIDLRPEAYGEPNGRGITIIGDFHVFNHLRSAIALVETIAWGKGSRGQLLMLGRRGDQEPVLPGLPAPKST
ncbi:hypothetical protein FOTG_15970 [Fusarium oxysporum f. sp. vasinfectum 25433]|nr:hypothetical protein FOTG_15970 [Fusarium oxysporum f. sp. vasinfectum 25433]